MSEHEHERITFKEIAVVVAIAGLVLGAGLTFEKYQASSSQPVSSISVKQAPVSSSAISNR